MGHRALAATVITLTAAAWGGSISLADTHDSTTLTSVTDDTGSIEDSTTTTAEMSSPAPPVGFGTIVVVLAHLSQQADGTPYYYDGFVVTVTHIATGEIVYGPTHCPNGLGLEAVCVPDVEVPAGTYQVVIVAATLDNPNRPAPTRIEETVVIPAGGRGGFGITEAGGLRPPSTTPDAAIPATTPAATPNALPATGNTATLAAIAAMITALGVLARRTARQG
jgi:hypothetical protein